MQRIRVGVVERVVWIGVGGADDVRESLSECGGDGDSECG